MSLCDCRGHFANGKEMARRRSYVASRDIDAAIYKMHRHKQRAASLLACDKQKTDALAACESLMPSGYRLYRVSVQTN